MTLPPKYQEPMVLTHHNNTPWKVNQEFKICNHHNILNSRSEYNRCSLPRLSTQLGDAQIKKILLVLFLFLLVLLLMMMFFFLLIIETYLKSLLILRPTVPTKVVGKAVKEIFAPAIIVGVMVPTMIVRTIVPRIFFGTAVQRSLS